MEAQTGGMDREAQAAGDAAAVADIQALPKAERHALVERLFVGYPRLKRVSDQMERCREWSKGAVEPYCLLVLGPSGAGKTTLVKRFIDRNPPTLGVEGTTVPILSATIPVPATMKTMATALLAGLKDPLAEKGTLDNKTRRLYRLLRECQVEMLILDEFQHFIDRDSDKVVRSVSDWLKNLISETSIPVVLTGMPYSRSVLDANEQLRRRFSAQETLEPFTWDGGGKTEFRRFLEKLDQALPFPESSGLADERMAFRFFRASDGLVAQVMKIVRGAAHAAIEAGASKLDLALLARAYAECILCSNAARGNPFLADWTGEPARAAVAAPPKEAGMGNRLKGKPREPSLGEMLRT